MTIAAYPGTFDPITNGHLDIIRRAASIFPKLIVAIAENREKLNIFSPKEREGMIKEEVKNLGKGITVTTFDCLLIDFVKRNNVNIIIRGLRASSDFDYEFQMACMNARLCSNVQTFFLPASENTHFISSRFVKQIAQFGGDISSLVSKNTAEKLKEFYVSN